MSVNSKMTAIADKIRSLLGISGDMTLDAMATNLETEHTNVANAFTAVGNKGGTVPTTMISGYLAAAINSIPAGATVLRAEGDFNTGDNGTVTINCGFKPDLVYAYFTDATSNLCCVSAAFYEAKKYAYVYSMTWVYYDDTESWFVEEAKFSQTNTGFNFKLYYYDYVYDDYYEDWFLDMENRVVSDDVNLHYIAIKYT